MGAAGDRHLGAALGKHGGGIERFGDLLEKDAMGLAQHQEVAGLGDVLRRRAPMHPAAMRLADNPAQLPDQRHDGVAGARETFVEPGAVHQVVMRRLYDGRGGFVGDDAEFGLRLGQRRLDIEPGLPAVLQPIKRANAGVGDAGGGGR